MHLRFSATWALVILIGVLALVGQWFSQVISSTYLEKTVREREIDKISAIGRIVKSNLSRETESAVLLAKVLSADPLITSQFDNAMGAAQTQLAKRVESMVGRLNGKAVSVIDVNERVVFNSNDIVNTGKPAVGWGIAEALDGSSMLVSTRKPFGVVIRAIEPIRLAQRVVGLIAVDVAIDQRLLSELSTEVGANLTVLDRRGLAIPQESGANSSADPVAIEEAFASKIPVFLQLAQTQRTRVYIPVSIVDEGYVVLADLDSTHAWTLITEGKRRFLNYGIIIVLVSVAIGFVALRVMLAPLRRLRRRAEKTTSELTGRPIETALGDEVASVVRALDTMTERLVERNRELELAKTSAEAANLSKSQFLSSMSHEIRTPLNGVLGMTELLRSTELNNEQMRFVGAISSAGRALNSLLTDVLDLAKIEQGQVELELLDFDLRKLSLDTIAIYRELASTKSLLLIEEIQDTVHGRSTGDPTRLRQVLGNLLGNAIKFTHHGQVKLRVESFDCKIDPINDWYRITVSDTGIGIPEHHLSRLFKRFTQADASTTRKYGGTGLGLAICRELVELMGGTIQITSTVGVGTQIWFDIPLKPATGTSTSGWPSGYSSDFGAIVAIESDKDAKPTAPTAPTAPARTHQGIKVLVAEDNEINQLVVAKLLGSVGVEVVLANDGSHAFERFKAESFDLVYMDCQMPVMDGFEATRQIRLWEATQPLRRTTPIVALTANALVGDRQACIDAGMNDYVAKPVSKSALTKALDDHVVSGRSPQTNLPLTPESTPVNSKRPSFDARALDDLPTLGDGSDDAFRDQMLNLFKKETQATLATIHQALAQGDKPSLLRTLHMFKATSAQMGALALSDEAKELEAVLRNNGEPAHDAHDRLAASFALFEQALDLHERARQARS